MPSASVARLPSTFLVAAVFAGALMQGAFYRAQFAVVELLVLGAVVSAVWSGSLRRADIRSTPVLCATAVAASVVVSASAVGAPTSAFPIVALLATLAASATVTRRLEHFDRAALFNGLIAAGLVVAAVGWVGVAFRMQPYAMRAQGLWRAASTITYANGAACVLAVVALIACARVVSRRSFVWWVAAFGSTTGLAATLSRAGAIAFLAGLVVIVWFYGPRSAFAALWPVAAASLVAALALVPSFPASQAANPGLALAGVAAGVLLLLVAHLWGPRFALGLMVGVVCAAALQGAAISNGLDRVRAGRISQESEDRAAVWTGSLRVAGSSPVLGVGPGRFLLFDETGGVKRVQRYAHNGYLQVLGEQGVVGLLVVVASFAALAASVVRSRARVPHELRWEWCASAAGLAAIAVHGGMDFVWHIPVVPLIGAVLVGASSPTTRSE